VNDSGKFRLFDGDSVCAAALCTRRRFGIGLYSGL
jgi:hypothetical protein